jgi:hypothetical protein
VNIVLNDSTPAVSPTSGCCASVSDNGAPVYIEMSVNGSAGSGTPSVGNSNTGTAWYYVGVSGQYDGQTIQAGTWTVPFNVTGPPAGVVKVHTPNKRDGAVWSAKRASTASTIQESTFRCCRRQVSTTVSSRSTNRLPSADCVPNDNFRQITA